MLFAASGLAHRLLEVLRQELAPGGLLESVAPVLFDPELPVAGLRPGEVDEEAVRELVGRPGELRADDQPAVPARQHAEHGLAALLNGAQPGARLFGRRLHVRTPLSQAEAEIVQVGVAVLPEALRVPV